MEVSVKVVEHEISRTAKLAQIMELMKQNGYDAESLLPVAKYEICTIKLTGTDSSFANAVRRVIMSEVDVYCMHIANGILTDDMYVSGTNDLLANYINLVPIEQPPKIIRGYSDHAAAAEPGSNSTLIIPEDHIVFLLKTNTSSEIIDVLASDIRMMKRRDFEQAVSTARDKYNSEAVTKLQRDVRAASKGDSRKTSQNNRFVNNGYEAKSLFDVPEHILYMSIAMRNMGQVVDFVPNPTSIVARLRPGKTLFIPEIGFKKGMGMHNAGCFSLVANIQYKILDVVPFGDDGSTLRSIEQDPHDFEISFRTACNITAKEIVAAAKLRLVYLVENMRNSVDTFAKFAANVEGGGPLLRYDSETLSVSIDNGVAIYSFKEHNTTGASMLARECYNLHNSCSFVCAGVARFDTNIGIVKIKHVEAPKLLIEACDSLLKKIAML